ncbi:molybdenum cofactor guanylyltransferase [Pseudoxanthomonas sp. z9]|uniref:molybdenum cofactor guanylyltransferase n=1 Tax=Pseudoxanthomonas sp. z9 TaxID=2584942 RepID=UPI001141F264|nr:molybdenum cofactor guanylyltransferase [Pseudoxanthomonas sp. z9]MCL6710996.1 molybdenum cofactor guanylyltransferase [Pseudomonas sp. R2.Fl]
MNDAVLPAWQGIVLAGGRSSRMGRDKALLEWRGRPLLEHMRALLSDAGATRVVISGVRPGADAIPDDIGDAGPAAALAQLVQRLPDGVWLVVPVDMPLLEAPALHALVAASVDCAMFEGHPLPMRITLDARTRAILAGIVDLPPDQRSLRAIHHALAGEMLAAGAWNATLVGCNTPEEWAALRERQ